jgi:predicted nucleic acid-binding protein
MEGKHYFADTSFLIDLFKGEQKAVEIMKDAETIITGTICLYELSKIAKFDREKFSANTVVEFTERDADKAAEFYRKLSEQVEKIGEADYLIAGQAHNSGRKLVTRDQDFQKLDIETRTYSV